MDIGLGLLGAGLLLVGVLLNVSWRALVAMLGVQCALFCYGAVEFLKPIRKRSESMESISSMSEDVADLVSLVSSMRENLKRQEDLRSNDSTNAIKTDANDVEREKPPVRRATTYYEWFQAACREDQHKSCWKEYDKVLLRDRRQALREARESGDIHYLKETLRGDLVRNLGKIVDSSSVFERKALPPKTIKSYVSEVVKDLRHVIDYQGEDFCLDEKIKYITEIYYS